MIYISLRYFALLVLVIAAYYLLPAVCAPYVLLTGSLVFYILFMGRRLHLVFLLGAAAVSFLTGLAIERASAASGGNARRKRLVLIAGIVLCLLPLLLLKLQPFAARLIPAAGGVSLIAPLGLSFYTLQMIAYMADVYRGKIRAEKNALRYLLFISFFPQILQGPIPRYEALSGQLWTRRPFEERSFYRGALGMLWGGFLKLMIADRAAPFVSQVFDHYTSYAGLWFLLAGVLYSLQLYADFLGCTHLALGAAEMLGIRLENNFDRPYFAVSLRDFWRRWHISLSRWLRDYVYIPLGGSRRGETRKDLNLILTFLVSGLWHGEGFRFLAWGLYHALCQIAGSRTAALRDRFFRLLRIGEQGLLRSLIRRGSTLFLVMCGWILFRAQSLRAGLLMLRSMLTLWNPWILLNGEAAALLPGTGSWSILLLSLAVLLVAGLWQRHLCIRDFILEQHLLLRWSFCMAAVAVIWVFGAYGEGWAASEFLYGGF